ncbi:cytochrome c1 [Acetobacter oeni]|uniref:Cytochrome c1 n=1 Tax=Acetobacter oeni TaxID=304077 RepID=A0A511XLD1_9PROT|nr:cytochrome c1 [Acetobacter oeni]MBB3883534.1 ubiquinol-cytochrome c reductase cytochrome c1 subunit [Acetobacter oeni]NHO19573.1 cytochrome c1 [Acetobacter oeni]GBR03093.1 ubiquinol-cytochrome c reductase cytochrome c1 [Acetobacter oeni LMG 21952]GEN63755.1 ribosomal protein P2 [Acetobacter oeni]
MTALRHRSATAIALVAAGILIAGGQNAHAEPPSHDPAPHQQWSFDGPLGNFDLASVQRGYTVYAEICSTCHGMQHVHFGDLAGTGLTAAQAQAIAASHKIPDGIGSDGKPALRAATADDAFPTPPVAQGLIPGAVIPPDQSRLAEVYPGGPDRIYALLTGYGPPPPGVTPPPGLFYNRFAQARAIAMPPPLSDDAVEYPDGTKATTEQEARDVTTFLAWVAQPHLAERHRTGVRVMIYLVFLGVLLFVLKRRLWSNVY